MKYAVIFSSSAAKELQKLPANVTKRIFPAIEKLGDNPRPSGSTKLVNQKENLWRIRIGDYRVIYLIGDTIKVVEIRTIGHRRDVYD